MIGEDTPIVVETNTHLIEICEGCLTIGTKQFPDDCVSLAREETEEVLRLLFRWKYDAAPGERK